MNRSFSVYLDALRVVAALAVLVSHWAYPRFTDGVYQVVRDLNIGSDAVVLFFVLSGLVIAYAADTKDRTARQYLFNRATRIYSVAVPAVLLTFVADRLGAAIQWPAYDGWWYNGASLPSTLWHALTFSNEWWGDFRVGTNGPYWSLSYEVAYYLIFAAAVYAKGAMRVVLVAALVFVAGPFVLLLMPIWLMGVGAWALIRTDRLLPRRTALIAAVAGPALYVAALAIDLPGQLIGMTESALGVTRAFNVLRFSDEFLWNWLTGLLATIHILGMASLLRTRPAAEPGRLARGVRWAAGASFSLYVVHYPVLMLVEVVTPEAIWLPLRHYLMLAVAIAACLLFARWFERPLPAFRAALRRIGARMRLVRPGVPTTL